MTQSILTTIVFALLISLNGYGQEADSQQAQTSFPAFSPQILWTDEGGDVQSVPVDSKLRWSWKDIESIGIKRPYIEMDLTLGDGFRFLQLVDHPQAEKVSDKKIRLWIDSEVSTFEATIEGPQIGQLRVGMVVQIPVGTPDTLVDESCRAMGIGLRPVSLKRTHLYSGLVCKDALDYTNIYIHHAKGRNQTDSKRRTSVEKGPNDSYLFKVSVQLDKYAAGDRITKFSVARDGEIEKSEFEVVRTDLSGKIPPRAEEEEKPKKKGRWAFSGGLGFTYLNYKERPLLNGNIDLSEIAMTLKVNVSYKISDEFTFGANTFGNAFALTKSPSSVSQARFFGVNGRIGYKLGFSNERHLFYINLGWYLWGMVVSGNNYGVDKLGGPQVLFLALLNTNQEHPIYAYMKIAPIFVNSQFSLSNREFALGGGYRLTNKAFGSIPLTLVPSHLTDDTF